MSGAPNRLGLTRVLFAVAVGVAACIPDESTTEPSQSSEAATGTAALTAPLAFIQVSASIDANHACGLTTDGLAYCWGFGYLGNDGSKSFSSRPVAVLGGRQYRNISAGYEHTCAVTRDDRAYCWGWNLYGQTGNGTRTSFGVPVEVTGGRRFRQISAGYAHTCGVTTDNLAFCWGRNQDLGLGGQLGDGTTENRITPVAVTGGHRFREVSAGAAHSCGVRVDSLAYCWGNNRQGRLGNGLTSLQRLSPSPVAGGRRYRQVSAGADHTCAVTTGDKGFCWGNGSSGQIGDGKTHQRWTPREVAGGIAFSRLAAGKFHTCGKTPNSLAYCWGANTEGALGDGTTATRLRPVAVSGGHRFSQVSAGWLFSCGVTPTSAAFCWGYNASGSLGDGTRVRRLRPAAVLGPM
jgi:alpha-tubulin suppressor-like RCC1 family protein